MRSRLAAVSAFCLLLAVDVAAQSNQLSFSNITARPGEERAIGLDGSFSDGMSGMVVTVLFDPTVIQVLDVSLTSLTDDFTLQSRVSGGRLSLAMAAAEDIETLFPEPVVELTVRVIGAPGRVTGLNIASAVVNEGDLSVTTVDGSVTVVREVSILGWVLYYADLQPVPDAELTATGTDDLSTVADADGRYELGPTAVGDYTVTIDRPADDLSAIDALDAADILRFLIGSIELTEDQAFVADVSGNGVIGTTDAGLILRYLVDLEDSFPAGDFWQFRPGELRYQPLIEDQFQNFTGYLLGDVDGSWEAGGAGKRLAMSGPRLELWPEPDRNRRGTILLRSDGDDRLRGGTVRIHYNPRALRIDDVRRAGLDGFLMASKVDATAGVIRLAFAGGESVDAESDLVRIDFQETSRPGTTTTVSVHAARLNRTDLPPAGLDVLFYRMERQREDLNADGFIDLSDFFLLIDFLGTRDRRYDIDDSGSVDMDDLFLLYDALGVGERSKAVAAADARGLAIGPGLDQNAPNPFNAETVIRYRLPVGGPVELSVFDLTGQRVRTLVSAEQTAGEHASAWDGRDNGGRSVASGVYVYRLLTADRAVERKLLLLR